MKNKKIGLYYGSFNPIHMGHLVVARKSLEDAELDEVWFVVSPQNPDKQRTGELEDAKHRFEMVRKAVENVDDIFACDVEFNLPQPSYTHIGLRVLREENPEVDFSIIGGSDLQLKMCRWKTHEEIVSHHNLIIYPRKLSGKDLKLKEANERVHSVTTYLKDVPVLEISATYIRNCIQSNKSIQYLVPDVVIEHIKINNLFNLK